MGKQRADRGENRRLRAVTGDTPALGTGGVTQEEINYS